MFGMVYFGQEDFASPPALVTPTGGGGWSHRGPVALPKRRTSMLPSLPKLPKPPYVFYAPEPDLTP